MRADSPNGHRERRSRAKQSVAAKPQPLAPNIGSNARKNGHSQQSGGSGAVGLEVNP